MIHRTFERTPPHGDPIHGDVRFAEGPPTRSAVVVLHGFKGFKDWGFLPWLCEEVAAAGHAAVAFNFSRGGVGRGREGVVDRELFASNTFTRELEDTAWIVERVLQGDLLPRPPDALALLGYSRGGSEAVLAVREGIHAECLVTWAASARLDRWSDEVRDEWRGSGRTYVLDSRTGRHLPVDAALLEDFEESPERLDVTAAAAEVPVPWLVVHGLDDRTVPAEEARILARRAASARLVLVEGAGHTFEVDHPFRGPSQALREALAPTLAHLARHLDRG